MTSRLLLAAALLVVVIGCGKKPAPEQAAADPDPQPAPRRVNPPQNGERDSTPFPKPAGERDSTPFPQPGQKKDPTPFPQPGAKAKTAPSWTEDDPAPGGKNAGVGRAARASVEVKGGEVVAFGPPGCPVMLVGQELYDLKTFESVGKLQEKPDQNSRPVLTHDGKMLAVTEKGQNQSDSPVFVYATDTGKTLLTVPARKEAYPDVIAFYGTTHLVVGGRHAPVMDVWEIATGKKVGGLTSPNRQVRHGEVAFAPDGSHFAAIAHDKLVVVATKTGKQAVMATPGGGGPLGAHGVFAWAKGLVFSPDGSELALFTTNPAPRLIVWNPKGQISLDAAVPMPKWVVDAALQWLPDSSGWLVNGVVFDRATKRVIAGARVAFGASAPPYLVDQSRVVGAFGQEAHRLRAADIPWPQIRESLTAMNAKADADLAPGRPVALDLRLTGVGGNDAETRTILGQALAARLGRDGIPVAAQAPTVLRLKLAEKAGDTLPIYSRQSPFDFKGADTGRKATEVNGAAVLELWPAGDAAPVWREALNAGSSRSFREEINDATIRKSMLEDLGRQLDHLNLPYFLPKNKATLALPAVID